MNYFNTQRKIKLHMLIFKNKMVLNSFLAIQKQPLTNNHINKIFPHRSAFYSILNNAKILQGLSQCPLGCFNRIAKFQKIVRN